MVLHEMGSGDATPQPEARYEPAPSRSRLRLAPTQTGRQHVRQSKLFTLNKANTTRTGVTSWSRLLICARTMTP
jgi:hypothetical protein